MATEYAGSQLVITWNSTGGSITLTNDSRKVTITPKVSLYDATAGADTLKQQIAGVKEVGVTMDAVLQGTAGTPTGTTALAALGVGLRGTLVIQPEGTAVGKPITTIVGIVTGAQIDIPYNNVVSIAASWECDGTTYTQA